MDFNDLTEEQKAKALACKTPEELLELVAEEGYDLTDEELRAVSGGMCEGEGTWICRGDCPGAAC